MNGHICLKPLEFLALAALPLAAFSGVLKAQLKRRFGPTEDDDKTG